MLARVGCVCWDACWMVWWYVVSRRSCSRRRFVEGVLDPPCRLYACNLVREINSCNKLLWCCRLAAVSESSNGTVAMCSLALFIRSNLTLLFLIVYGVVGWDAYVGFQEVLMIGFIYNNFVDILKWIVTVLTTYSKR